MGGRYHECQKVLAGGGGGICVHDDNRFHNPRPHPQGVLFSSGISVFVATSRGDDQLANVGFTIDFLFRLRFHLHQRIRTERFG